MGSILNKSNTQDSLIYPESNINETTNETVIDIVEPPLIQKPMERCVNESQLINKLEQDGYDKLKTLGQTLPVNTTKKDIGDALLNIIKSGADEFKEKTGRQMTYAEMRAAYG